MKDYSNYHSINTRDKIFHHGNFLFDYTLSNSLEAYDVEINNESHKVIIQTKSSDTTGEKRNILCKPNVIDRGSVVRQGDIHWMVITLPIDNGIYTKATIQLINTSITIKGEKVPTAYDRLGNPTAYSGGEDQTFICIADKSMIYGSADMNKAINDPDNKIKIIIPYTDSKFEKFILYNESYVVRDTDLTQVMNGKGLITITAERIVEES